MSQSDWQTVLNQLLAKIESKTKFTLHEINDIFQQSENKIDDKFRKNFLDILNNRVSETYERFEIDASSNSQQKVWNEATSTVVYIKPVIHSSDTYPSSKRKTNVEPDSNLNDSDAGPSSDSVVGTFLYTCVHCQDKENANRTYSSIERCHKHWTSAHSVKMSHSSSAHSALPFQFYVSEIVKCYYCSKIGNYAEVRDHHKRSHSSNDPLGMVLLNDTNACALCNTNHDDLVNHFQLVHNIINKAHVYNPMCMTDQAIDQLLAIKIHEMAMHYLNAHNGVQMKVSTGSSDKSIRVICWYCDKMLAATDFMQHIRSHSNAMKCTECKFSSANINDHVKHAGAVHNTIRTVNDINVAFSDMLKRKFFETKIFFGNGLVLVKHNLLDTRMNDSREFGCFIKELLEVKKNHQLKGEPIVVVDDDEQRETSPIDELKKQTQLLDCLQISDFPNVDKMNVLKLFLRYTEHLEYPLSVDDVDKVYRLDGNRAHLIVKFKTDEAKEQILQSATEKAIESGHLVDLSPGEVSKPIKVENFLTPWFKNMNQIAVDARKAGKIQCFWINKGGMAVKRTKNAPPTFVWSADQLITFINHNA